MRRWFKVSAQSPRPGFAPSGVAHRTNFRRQTARLTGRFGSIQQKPMLSLQRPLHLESRSQRTDSTFPKIMSPARKLRATRLHARSDALGHVAPLSGQMTRRGEGWGRGETRVEMRESEGR